MFAIVAAVLTRSDVLLGTAILELVARLDRAEPWMRDALCLEHPEVNWFPARGESPEPAKAICAACLVRQECASFAAAHRIGHGVWGGLSGQDRRRARSPHSSPATAPRAHCTACAGLLPRGRLGHCCACADLAVA